MEIATIILFLLLFVLICYLINQMNQEEKFESRLTESMPLNCTEQVHSMVQPIEFLNSQHQEMPRVHRTLNTNVINGKHYVKLYDFDDYEGTEWLLEPGEYRLSDMIAFGLQLNQVTSLILAPNTSIDLYYEDNFRGHLNDGEHIDHTVVNQNSNREIGIPKLSDYGWGKQTASIKINIV